MTTIALNAMGGDYAPDEIPKPRVAILSNGTEEIKGTAEMIKAHKFLKEFRKINFVGNIEGVDIPKGTADKVAAKAASSGMIKEISATIKDFNPHKS